MLNKSLSGGQRSTAAERGRQPAIDCIHPRQFETPRLNYIYLRQAGAFRKHGTAGAMPSSKIYKLKGNF